MQTYRAIKKGTNEFVYGLPSYGFETEEIKEIGTVQGDFVDIIPSTLGRDTGYTDANKEPIYTGDITALKVGKEVREFEVVETTLDRVYNTQNGFKGEKVKVRLQGVIAFVWTTGEGERVCLLPCVDSKGICDTEKMRIVGNIHTCIKGPGE